MSFDSEVPLLKISQVAQQFGLHRQTIRGWIKQGKLPALKIGGSVRIRVEDLGAVITEKGEASA